MKKENILLRVSEFEKKAIKIKAEKIGLTTSEYCRRTALGKDLPKAMSDKELEPYLMLKEYKTDFARLANLFKRNDPTFHKKAVELTKVINEEMQKIRDGQ